MIFHVEVAGYVHMITQREWWLLLGYMPRSGVFSGKRRRRGVTMAGI
jgi:hypothetical protein